MLTSHCFLGLHQRHLSANSRLLGTGFHVASASLVAKNDLGFLTLPDPEEGWDYRHAPPCPCQVHSVPGMALRTLYLLGKGSTH